MDDLEFLFIHNTPKEHLSLEFITISFQSPKLFVHGVFGKDAKGKWGCCVFIWLTNRLYSVVSTAGGVGGAAGG